MLSTIYCNPILMGPLGNVPGSNTFAKGVKNESERLAHGIALAQTNIKYI
jgi:hypothetical protein